MASCFGYWMNVSVDLRIECASDEQGGGGKMRIGETLHREFNARARGMSLMVEGRTIYETIKASWLAAREDESLPDYATGVRRDLDINVQGFRAAHAQRCWPYTRIIGEGAFEQLAALRARPDSDIGVDGATLATQLLRANLLDELLLFTRPVILGTGRPLFDRHDQPVELDWLELLSFDDGATMHRYAVHGAHAAGQN